MTIPYKEEVMSFLDEVNEIADEIGAVNTIKIKDGKATGFNTDVYGFMQSLMPKLETAFLLHSFAEQAEARKPWLMV